MTFVSTIVLKNIQCSTIQYTMFNEIHFVLPESLGIARQSGTAALKRTMIFVLTCIINSLKKYSMLKRLICNAQWNTFRFAGVSCHLTKAMQ